MIFFLKSTFSLKAWFSLKFILAFKQRVKDKDNLQNMQPIQEFNFKFNFKHFKIYFQISVHCDISIAFKYYKDTY